MYQDLLNLVGGWGLMWTHKFLYRMGKYGIRIFCGLFWAVLLLFAFDLGALIPLVVLASVGLPLALITMCVLIDLARKARDRHRTKRARRRRRREWEEECRLQQIAYAARAARQAEYERTRPERERAEREQKRADLERQAVEARSLAASVADPQDRQMLLAAIDQDLFESVAKLMRRGS